MNNFPLKTKTDFRAAEAREIARVTAPSLTREAFEEQEKRAREILRWDSGYGCAVFVAVNTKKRKTGRATGAKKRNTRKAGEILGCERVAITRDTNNAKIRELRRSFAFSPNVEVCVGFAIFETPMA
jgi:hypothetical protein